jgi:hypothetical protein
VVRTVTQNGYSAFAVNITPPFWAAVRLTAFANLSVTPENWLSLFVSDRSWLSPELLADLHALTPQAKRAAGLQGRLPRIPKEPYPPPGQLWKEFEAAVRTYGKPPTLADWFSQRRPAIKRLAKGGVLPLRRRSRSGGVPAHPAVFPTPDIDWLGSPLYGWPSVTPGDPTDHYPTFNALHRRTSKRLRLIADGSELSGLIRELQDTRLRLHFRAAIPGNRPDRFGTFFATVDARTVNLESHLNWLFIQTAIGGLWPRLFRCAECSKFAVAKLRRNSTARVPPKFCSDKCRSKNSRGARKVDRSRRHDAIVRELRERQAGGEPDALRTVETKYGLSPKQISALLRR